MPHDDKFIGGKNGRALYACAEILLCAVLAKQGEWMSCGSIWVASWWLQLSRKMIVVKYFTLN